jgi:hypothetical protein
MNDIINTMREIAFRTSIAAASKASLAGSTQSVPYNCTATQIVYVTNYSYLFIAVAISLLGVLAVISTFWGWWEDGREISVSPLEIAKAFDAPLLVSADGNATAKELIVQIGGHEVKYGEVIQSVGFQRVDGMAKEKAKFTFGRGTSTNRPRRGTTYS